MTSFNTIGLIGKPDAPDANQCLKSVLTFLQHRGCRVLLEKNTAKQLTDNSCDVADLAGIGEQADLAIVVGGDGSMLGAARELSKYNVSVVGVNRGNLGFLTDIDPEDVEPQLEQIFQGNYKTEQRFLIEAKVKRNGQCVGEASAVNEAVLHPGKVARMIEFEVYIDDNFVYSQRSDGLIIATPTGSTAYSLSGGGPILTPNLDALSMVPMFPHTLSARPIVIDASSTICLLVVEHNKEGLQVSCDGQTSLAVEAGDRIYISKSPNTLSLIHPINHSYFKVLRNKLGWGSKLF
ncbi:NAD(+) kinase [Neptunicella marina]|uniref:NAD kinase n=1 Tax=Neptunicella marina TaxID=2125989 RepID=A0A8J6M0I9_9ALTE|nr:NAD(+) kinase [Neptunicella marina]MBC3767199.1 NAD(+) kinase [Neptunicella marina]